MEQDARTAGAWLQRARRRLAAVGLAESAEREARLLLEHASGERQLRWLARPERELAVDLLARADELLARRATREPLAYLLGTASFYGRDFEVGRGVLVPREDSAALIELALELPLPESARVLEVGVGSGCLVITLLLERPRWRGAGVDLDATALRCSRANAVRHGLTADPLSARRLALWRGDALGALRPDATFDLLLVNPPYVTPGELARCEPEVREWEPALALLVPEEDPLAPYRALAERWSRWGPGATIVCEVGAGRADEVAALLRANGAREVRVRADLGGIPRAVGAVL